MSVHRRVVERASSGLVSRAVVSPVSSAGTNWTIIDSAVRRWGPTAMIWVRAERTTSALTPNSEGDLSNETVATLTADCRGAVATLQPLTSGHVGRVVAGYYNCTTGQLVIAASAGAGDAIDIGEEITLGGVVYLD